MQWRQRFKPLALTTNKHTFGLPAVLQATVAGSGASSSAVGFASAGPLTVQVVEVHRLVALAHLNLYIINCL